MAVPADRTNSAIPVAGVLQVTVPDAARSGALTVDGVRVGTFRAKATTSLLVTAPVRPDGKVVIGTTAAAKQPVRVDLAGYLVLVPQPASAPGQVTATMTAPHTATVTWQPSVTDPRAPVLAYQVTAIGPSSTQTITAPATATSQVVTGLADGVWWMFSVAATTRFGPSLLGPPSQPVRYVDPVAPGAPGSVSAHVSAPGTVSLTWSAPTSDGGSSLTGYTVAGGVGGPVSVPAGTTSYTWSGLTVGQTYSFTVAARNAAGSSPTSSSSAVFVTGAAGTLVNSVVSVDGAGQPPADGFDNAGGQPAMSATGRWVAFSSTDPLVAGDTNGVADVFLRDTQTGTTTRISSTPGGAAGDGLSTSGSVSADGRYVVFTSSADDLVTGDTNNTSDIFVRDTQTGTTTRVDVSSAGAQTDLSSLWPRISADGHSVSFVSQATNLVLGETNHTYGVYLRDLVHGTTIRVSRTSTGDFPDDFSFNGGMSADGRYIGWSTDANGIVAGDDNGADDSFVFDRQTGTTQRVSVSSTGAQLSGDSDSPMLSSDGRFVLFGSSAAGVTADGATGYNLYERDMQTGAVTLVSKTNSGGLADGVTYGGYVSDDGTRVLFSSAADNLVAGDTNGVDDVFVRYLATGETVRVSVGAGGAQLSYGVGAANAWGLSGDGKVALFAATGTGAVPGVDAGGTDLAYERTLG